MARGLNLTAVTRLDTKELQAGLKRAQGMLNGFKKFVAAAFAFRGLTQLGKEIINVSKDFENAMARVQSVTNASVTDMQLMTAEARKMGETTRYTATQAANALEVLTRNGVSAKNATIMLSDVLQMAQANVIELSEAATIITNTLNMFGLRAEDAGKVNDVLSQTASHAATNVTELYQALTNLAPAANTLGFSIEETSAAIGALAQRGVKGFDAGTQLRMALVKLADPKIIKKMQAMGVAIDEMSMREEGYLGTVQRLRDAHLSLSDLVGIFSQKGAVGMQQLIASYEDFSYLVDLNANSADTASRMYEQAIGSVQKELDILKSKWESLMITIGNSTSGPFKAVIKFLQQIIDNCKSWGGFLMNLSTVVVPLFVRSLVMAGNGVKTFAATVKGVITTMGGWVTIIATLITDIGFGLYNSFQKMQAPLREANDEIFRLELNSKSSSEAVQRLVESLNSFDDEHSINSALREAISLFPEFEDALMSAYKVARDTGDLEHLKQVLLDIADLQVIMNKQKAQQMMFDANAESLGMKMKNWGSSPYYGFLSMRKQINSNLGSISDEKKDVVYTELAKAIISFKTLDEQVKAFQQTLKNFNISTGISEEKTRDYIDYINRNGLASGFFDITDLNNRDNIINGRTASEQLKIIAKERSDKEFKVLKQAFDDTKARNDKDLKDKLISQRDYQQKMYDAADKFYSRILNNPNMSEAQINIAREIASKYPAPPPKKITTNTPDTTSKTKTDKDKVQDIIKKYETETNGLKDLIMETGDADGHWADELVRLRENTLDALTAFGGLSAILAELGKSDVYKELLKLYSIDVANKQQTKQETVDDKLKGKYKEFVRGYIEENPGYDTRNTLLDFSKKQSTIDKEEVELLQEQLDKLNKYKEKLEDDFLGKVFTANSLLKDMDKQIANIQGKLTDAKQKLVLSTWREEVDELRKSLNKDLVQGISRSANAMSNLLTGWQALAGEIDKDSFFGKMVDGFDTILSYINYVTQAFDSVIQIMETWKTVTETMKSLNAMVSKEFVKEKLMEAGASEAAASAQAEEAVAAATSSGAKLPFPYNIAAIVAGVAAVVGALAMMSKFADGGIVGGNSTSGDRQLARVNAGEMILNKSEQGNLFKAIASGNLGGGGEWRVKGTELIKVIENTQRKIRG